MSKGLKRKVETVSLLPPELKEKTTKEHDSKLVLNTLVFLHDRQQELN